jgi:signal peptidase II
MKIWVKTHMPLSNQWDYYHTPLTRYDKGIPVIGEKFQIYFVENEGMAWGKTLGGYWGKTVLTLFRMAAVIFGVFYLGSIVQKKYHRGFIICAGLIFAGALGNLIDSLFYGIIFEESSIVHVAKIFPAHGYTGLLHGRVVDMLYFPLIHSHYPNWVPLVGGDVFEFFSPVFNIADASISIGVITILLFQQRFFKKKPEDLPKSVETNSEVNDTVQVS